MKSLLACQQPCITQKFDCFYELCLLLRAPSGDRARSHHSVHHFALPGEQHSSTITIRQSDAALMSSPTNYDPLETTGESYLNLLACTYNELLCSTFLLECITLLWGQKDGFAMTGHYSSGISPSNKNVPRCSSPYWDNLQHDEVQLCAA